MKPDFLLDFIVCFLLFEKVTEFIFYGNMRLSIARHRLFQYVNDFTFLSEENRGNGPHDRPGDPVIFNNDAVGLLAFEYLKDQSGTADPCPNLVLYNRSRVVDEHQQELDCNTATRDYIRKLLRGEAHLIHISGCDSTLIEFLAMPREVNHHFVYRYMGFTWKPVDFHFERRLPHCEEEAGEVSFCDNVQLLIIH